MPSNEGVALSHRTDPFKVLVIGGSYGGLASIVNLLDLCNSRSPRTAAVPPPITSTTKVPIDITIVDERDGFFHLISAPLALASRSFAPKAWTKFGGIPALKNVRVLHGSAKDVDCKRKRAIISEAVTKAESEVEYDFLIAASGLRRVWPVVPQSTTRNDYLEEASSQIDALGNAQEGVVVVGGGAVGIEMAAEIKLLMPQQRVTLIHSRDKLCSSEPLPDEFKDRCLKALHEAGVQTIMSQRVLKTEEVETEKGKFSKLKLANGEIVEAGEVIYAISKSFPSTTYLPAAALDEDRYVKVSPSLSFQSETPNSSYHFAVGDIAKWSGIKRCGSAMHMGQYVAYNIHQVMLKQLQGTEPKLMELDEIPPMIAIAVGKTAVAYHPAEGTTFGEDLLSRLFGNDLGLKVCWDHLRLSDEADGNERKL